MGVSFFKKSKNAMAAARPGKPSGEHVEVENVLWHEAEARMWPGCGMGVNWAEAYARRRPWEAVNLITGINGMPLRLMVESSISSMLGCARAA
jgi:hypothetical protein